MTGLGEETKQTSVGLNDSQAVLVKARVGRGRTRQQKSGQRYSGCSLPRESSRGELGMWGQQQP